MEKVRAETGAVFISPYDHLDVIAGQVSSVCVYEVFTHQCLSRIIVDLNKVCTYFAD